MPKIKLQGSHLYAANHPETKIRQVEKHGHGNIEIFLIGDTFDDCLKEALQYPESSRMVFVPPFDHPEIIAGQGTIGIEILEDLPSAEIIIIPIGDGGLAAGLEPFSKRKAPTLRFTVPSPKAQLRCRWPLKMPGQFRYPASTDLSTAQP